MKQEVPLKVVKVTLYCDECGMEMRCENVLTSYPAQYEHKCKHGHKQVEDTHYPSIEYRKLQ